MHHLLKSLINLDKADITFENIADILKKYKGNASSYYSKNIKSTSRGYLRIPLLHDLVQVYIMIWPPNENSSIHEHKNFSGLIKVIEGAIEEDDYQFDETNRKLIFLGKKEFKKDDLIIEKENAIHQVFNTSPTSVACTLHVYFPPNSNIAGSRLFDFKKDCIATLSEDAFSFSWNQPEEAFSNIDYSGFQLIKNK